MNTTTLTRWSLRLASLLVCLALWQVLSARQVNLGLVTFANVPTARAVLLAAWNLAQSSKLGRHLGGSLLRVLAGYLLAAFALGIALGLPIGRSAAGRATACCRRWKCCGRSRRWPGFPWRS